MIQGEMITGSVSYWTMTYNQYLTADVEYIISFITDIIT